MPGMTAEQIEACLGKQKETKTQNARKPATFPSGLSGKTLDAQTQQYRTMVWRSKDGTSLIYETTLPCTLVCSGGNIFVKEVEKERVISFTQGIAGEGNTANSAVVGTAIAAAIVPILAPFQALTTARSTRTFAYTITYLSDQGDEITDNLLAESLVPEHDWFYTFLPTFTGLEAGQRKSVAELRPYYKDALKVVDSKIASDKSILYTKDSKKPWCSVSLASKYPLISRRYQDNLSKSNKIRLILGENPLEGIDEGSHEAKWQKYLEGHPNLKIWAEANPTAAERVRSCSA